MRLYISIYMYHFREQAHRDVLLWATVDTHGKLVISKVFHHTHIHIYNTILHWTVSFLIIKKESVNTYLLIHYTIERTVGLILRIHRSCCHLSFKLRTSISQPSFSCKEQPNRMRLAELPSFSYLNSNVGRVFAAYRVILSHVLGGWYDGDK